MNDYSERKKCSVRQKILCPYRIFSYSHSFSVFLFLSFFKNYFTLNKENSKVSFFLSFLFLSSSNNSEQRNMFVHKYRIVGICPEFFCSVFVYVFSNLYFLVYQFFSVFSSTSVTMSEVTERHFKECH